VINGKCLVHDFRLMSEGKLENILISMFCVKKITSGY